MPALIAAAAEHLLPPTYTCQQGPSFEWPSTPPESLPLPLSPDARLRFTGRSCAPTLAYMPGGALDNITTRVVDSDTWYPKMGNDGLLWSPWIDGSTVGLAAGGTGNSARLGWAVLEGYSAARGFEGMRVSYAGTIPTSAAPLVGRYPCAAFSANGTWLYGTYGLDQGPRSIGGNATRTCPPNNGTSDNSWCIGGPFIGFHASTDQGASWGYGKGITDMNASAAGNLFRQPWPTAPAPFQFKLMQPHFVDHGANNALSPDGHAYLVSHGCDAARTDPAAHCGWIQGSQIYLLRSSRPLTVDSANDPDTYEFWAGSARGWVRGVAGLGAAAPIVDWADRTGVTNVVWVAAKRRYLMFVTHPSSGGESGGTLDSWVAEAKALTGPWRLVSYWAGFGSQGYFLHAPSPFWAGGTGWLWYSANWFKRADLQPNPAFCNFATARNSTPFTDRGNCYGSVLGQIEFDIASSLDDDDE